MNSERGDYAERGCFDISGVCNARTASAIENIKDAIKVCLEVRAEKGMPLTVETRQVEAAA